MENWRPCNWQDLGYCLFEQFSLQLYRYVLITSGGSVTMYQIRGLGLFLQSQVDISEVDNTSGELYTKSSIDIGFLIELYSVLLMAAG